VATRSARDTSADAFRTVSARLALLWCVVALAGVPFALGPGGWSPVAVAVEVGVATCSLAAARTFLRRSGAGWAVLTLVVLVGTTALVGVGAAGALRPEAAHQVVSWVNSGIGAALAFTFGARWGLAAFVVDVPLSVYAEAWAGGPAVGALDSAIGPFTYVVGAGLVRWAALRGEATTQRALSAKSSAEGALRVAAERWDAARAVQRELHDTVLATLTMLAHRGEGVPAATVVQACARDAEQLRRGTVARPPADGQGADEGADEGGGQRDGEGGGQRDGEVTAYRETGPNGSGGSGGSSGPGEVVDLVDVVRDVVAGVRSTGDLEIRLHVGDDVPVAGRVAEAVRQSLGECLENVRRHAGVLAADVTAVADGDQASVMVVDEGLGFDPDAVPPDRLGLRESVSGRLVDVGGSASVWSGPGLGTSVLLAVPLAGAPARDAGRAGVGGW
jgi:signal transduction histidine kinase